MIDFPPIDTTKLLKEVRKDIARLEKIARLLGSSSSKGKGKGKRKLSAEARKAIGDAQRKRWAAKKKKSE
jgi:hypothetical protein